jgi:hypothetical protein
MPLDAGAPKKDSPAASTVDRSCLWPSTPLLEAPEPGFALDFIAVPQAFLKVNGRSARFIAKPPRHVHREDQRQHGLAPSLGEAAN